MDSLLSSIFNGCLVTAMFYAIPWMLTSPRLYESASRTLAIEPWAGWSKKSTSFFQHLSFSIRIPFFAVAFGIGTCVAIVPPGPLAEGVVCGFGVTGVIAGLVNYLCKRVD
jgi:hypothetical protein